MLEDERTQLSISLNKEAFISENCILKKFVYNKAD